MKDNKEYLKDIYAKYEQEKDKTTVFYNQSMNKRPKVLSNVAVALIVMMFATTGVFGGIKIYEKILMQPSITQELSNTDTNQMWCATFQLVWNDLMNDVIGGPVEFIGYESALANELNKQSFTRDMLSEGSYYKVHGNSNNELRSTIEHSIKQKFNEDSEVLESIQWDSQYEGYVLYAMLKKEFNFMHPFDILDKDTFAKGTQNVSYFGIDKKSDSKLYKNINVLFYNSQTDFAVKLITKENEEVILYRTDDNTSFEDKYIEIVNKSNKYEKAKKQFTSNDTLKVPYICVENKINYDELCNKPIKNTDWIIIQALQTIDIQIDNIGGKLLSEAVIELEKLESNPIQDVENLEFRDFSFDDNFVMFLKEADKEKPYFAIHINDDQVLVK